MSVYYPQAAMKLRILLEDFKLTSDASKQKPYEVIVVPENVTVNVNDHKTSDSFSAELDYRNFPFDPRSVRACGVVIYVANTERLYADDGSLNKLVPSDDNAVFAGFVDTDTMSFDDTSGKIKFEGRDFTSLLIDQKYKENLPIDYALPIDVLIRNFLNTFPATKEITLDNQTGGVLPNLAKYHPDLSSPMATMKNPGAHESYWEIIQDIVHRAGLICYFHLNHLVITTPRNLYNDAADLKIIYGKNIKSIEFKRKLGRIKNFNIQVRSRAGKEVITAKIPEEATLAWCKGFGIDKAVVFVPVLKPDGSLDNTVTHPAPYITFPIPNISNKDQLIRIGQTIFEDYSRQQLEGSLETHEMVGHAGKDETDPNWVEYDLTQLDVGQPLGIEIARDDLATIQRMKSTAERIYYLIGKNYPEDIASVFASTLGKFSPRFFTKGYSMTVNKDSGFQLKIEFINIIELSYRNL
jgi:hypothetical protein